MSNLQVTMKIPGPSARFSKVSALRWDNFPAELRWIKVNHHSHTIMLRIMSVAVVG